MMEGCFKLVLYCLNLLHTLFYSIHPEFLRISFLFFICFDIVLALHILHVSSFKVTTSYFVVHDMEDPLHFGLPLVADPADPPADPADPADPPADPRGDPHADPPADPPANGVVVLPYAEKDNHKSYICHCESFLSKVILITLVLLMLISFLIIVIL